MIIFLPPVLCFVPPLRNRASQSDAPAVEDSYATTQARNIALLRVIGGTVFGPRRGPYANISTTNEA